jgi:hypothetical protein
MKKSHLNLWLFSIGLIISAGSVVAAEQGTVIEKRDVVKVQADEKICKRVAQTGTRFKKKVCLKASKWVELQQESQETLRAIAGPAGNSGS